MEIKKTENSYIPELDYVGTITAISMLKTFFSQSLSKKLNLIEACAPLFVSVDTGLNDDLNGFEKYVEFVSKSGEKIGIVQSLAKWKRYTLGRFDFKPNSGIYTNMNAIRKDETLTCIHSYYVDQWDWEMVITKQERTYNKLVEVVEKIYACLVDLDKYMTEMLPTLSRKLPDNIKFISSQELMDMYPGKSANERERLFSKKYGAIFITQIGKTLKSGEPHDSRSPDYDDWGLNGDIIVYSEVLDRGLELSSMGIRVDKHSMLEQLRKSGAEDRLKFQYHQMILDEELPFTIGGGIGQSRVAMFFLEKLHIGEVQSSVWSKEIIEKCSAAGIPLL